MNRLTPTQAHPLYSKFKTCIAALLISSLGVSASISAAQAQPKTASITNRAKFTYTDPSGYTFRSATNQLQQSLIDPLGRITGCAGEVLSNYSGFSVSVYETDVSGIELGALVPLTRTELPDVPNNGISAGLDPNRQNSNPFFLSASNDGRYNFLLDDARGQLAIGKRYILVINPPQGSIYSQRRVRLTITARNGRQVSYTATSLDGRPLNTTTGVSSIDGQLSIQDAEQVGLSLAAIDVDASICQAQAIQIIKTGDRANATPGDTILYRLSIRNLASAPVSNLTITDLLPLGFRFRENSAKAEFQDTSIPVTATANGSTITFTLPNITLPANTGSQAPVLNIAYAATLTPDAIRGTGQNRALVQGTRSDNQDIVRDGPALHRLRVRNGLLTDCGTIIGRVFEDKNFDGEQQPGEPGIPNAVVFLDDGNRITTDQNGLFSVANVLAGYRTGVLDLSSIPGYTLAPNQKFHERNSQSRLVRLAPGGLVRMNFAVTPALREAGK
ncbi:DUF11 domain-containing protein [Pseudanabaenaceae cyanobacterium LEGE 13415]|nr:DUF11 domain-containing protein [Pseudanabaenaceae cyanobacterium LEGE 13415]